MTLRSALDDFKRHRGESTVFPGERRTTAGRFSGLEDRLVHVGRDGSLRDFSYPLAGLYGIDRSRFGLRCGAETRWLEDVESVSQRYAGETALVETRYETGDAVLERADLTIGRTHVTQFDLLEGGADVDGVAAFVAFAPGGREDRIGQLVFEERGIVEVYHRREHDFLASATGFDAVVGQLPERLPDVLSAEPAEYPNGDDTGQYEDGRLGGYVFGVVPLEDGRATVVTALREEPEREAALAELGATAREFADPAALRAAAEDQRPYDAAVPATVAADLRVLELLSAPGGGRIAGPDFDPHYEYSGGYGYTWFRDDGEISRFLLESETELGLADDLEAVHEDTVDFYAATQRPDGTWPHRVWPDDGTLAPGWANDRMTGAGVDYQADQTASVCSFLAAAVDAAPSRRERVDPIVARGLEGLDDTLAADGLPATCQNAWENMAGRFTHTAATYLHAYATIADAPFSTECRDRAAERAREVSDALDDLWVPERGIYALREREGELDDRLDSSTLALVDAHRASAEVADLDGRRLERLTSHVETTLEGLRHTTDAVDGLSRFEGDDWRTRDQRSEKIWTVSTAWGANAAALFATLSGEERFYGHARALLRELLPGGSLCLESGYLPEQVFDDGTPDSATPLGWPHAIRLATVAHLSSVDELEAVGADV
ncbi:glycoside hydrolase family 15 protein [Natrononativus amylolyticus]|uniref:glycoside hydrolase family 15 protein n=1 Tax=Natrononativus amylolyticus TaxID=2963434 RepID=UPI0020CBF023|nr:glycoside hydrolase family 15 protein [Natrononativus amylolyticus]